MQPTAPADIAIEPSDWFIANWRDLAPWPRPRPQPFDLEDCIHRLQRVRPSAVSFWDWSEAQIQPVMTAEEGQFWLGAFVRMKKMKVLSEVGAALKAGWPIATSREEVIRRLYDSYYILSPGIVPALASLFDSATVVDTLLAPWKHPLRKGNKKPAPATLFVGPLMDGYRRLVRPYLKAAERTQAQKVVQAELNAWKQEAAEQPPGMLVSMAACLGLSARVSGLLKGVRKAELLNWFGQQALFVLFGLGDAEAVRKALKRYHLGSSEPQYVGGLLAHLESGALEFMVPEILQARSRAEAERLMEGPLRVSQAAAARYMLELTLASRGPAPAQRWLDEHRELAVEGLLPLVDDEKLGEGARIWLRGLIRSGNGAIVERQLTRVEANLARRVRRILETTVAAQGSAETAVPDWFPPATRAPLPVPSWLDLAALPAILVGGKALPVAQIEIVLTELDGRSPESPGPLLGLLKQHADPRSLDGFAWELFARWQANGSPAACKWPMTALGVLGGESVSRNLVPVILRWPSEGRHRRATQGLECLRAIGADPALLALAEVASRGRSLSIGTQAEQMLGAMAEEMGLTREQLDDCLVPTLGLDQSGYRLLDFGKRVFHLTLGPDLTPCLLDDRRTFISDLPDLDEQDDPVKVEVARCDWELFREQATTEVQRQRERLRHALDSRSQWRAQHFLQRVVRHPLLNYLIRPLVWGALDGPWKLRLSFRVTAERTCVDIAGSPVDLDPAWQVCLAHPTALSAEERLIWSDVFAENGLVQPFPQLQREVFVLNEAQRQQREWKTPEPLRVSWGEFNHLMFTHGWNLMYAPQTVIWAKAFGRQRVLAQLLLADASYPASPNHVLRIEGFTIWNNTRYIAHMTDADRLVLGEVDPIVLDDVLRMMHALSRQSRSE